jgi:type III secretion protein V
LAAKVRRAAGSFQTREGTRYILDSLKSAFPDLVDLALERYGLERIHLVLRNLLEESISIRDFRGILEALLAINGTTNVNTRKFIVFPCHTDGLCPVGSKQGIDNLPVSDYSDYVRTALKRYISHKYMKGSSTLIVYLVHADIEQIIAERELSSEEVQQLRSAVQAECGSLPPSTQSPVVLTDPRVRRKLKKLIEPEIPDLDVLSYYDLSPEINIQPIARITWD